MTNKPKPEFLFLDRKGVPMKFNPLCSDASQQNETIFASSGAGMRMLEDYKENSAGMGVITANDMHAMAHKSEARFAIIDKGRSYEN